MDNVTEAALTPGLARKEAGGTRRFSLERLGLRADHRPGQASGGQAQRVAL